MKTTKLFLGVLLCFLTISVSAQTADEIIANYFENTGGETKWRELKGYKTIAAVNQGGMEIPIESVELINGKTSTKVTFQGKEIKQGVFDGTTLWSHNFMTMKAEKSDSEATKNYKISRADFPSPFLDYKKKGYKIELLGKEENDGTETFKIKLTKTPLTIDGKTEDNVDFYYFDTENFVPIVVESKVNSGPGKGLTSVTTLSDYQEAGDLYMPYSIAQSIKERPGSETSIVVKSYELNPEVSDEIFAFPDDKSSSDEKKN
ncbi:outer membrane lipoprotein-sorting protein [Tenacibaculum xiamenense]|uniref:outer membrane lipoprotein-sorting protein n=1 Tax=Tenacibaculum xiamenense TaxID=1261553 RepID=UPI003894B163